MNVVERWSQKTRTEKEKDIEGMTCREVMRKGWRVEEGVCGEVAGEVMKKVAEAGGDERGREKVTEGRK